jgi:hypothetical protein
MDILQIWWKGLALELQIFYTIGIISTFMVFIQTLLMLIMGEGGDGDIPDDMDVSGSGMEHPSDMSLLSTRTIVAFFMGFGWTGVICLKNGFSLEMSILISFITGTIFLFTIYYLMKGLYSLRASGNINYRNAIGKIATVYIPIPPNQTGPGQIELLVQERVRFVQAFSNHTERIPSSTRVKITDLIDPVTLLVEPLSTPAQEEENQ